MQWSEHGHSRWISQSWHVRAGWGWNRVSGAFDTSGAVKYSPALCGRDLDTAPDKSYTPHKCWGRGMKKEREREREMEG